MNFLSRNVEKNAYVAEGALGSEPVGLQNWLSDRHDDLLVMLAPAIHEAGHVLAARAHGFEVAWVSLDPEFIATNPLAIENKCIPGCPVAMVIASPRIGPIMKRGCVISREEWDIVEGFVLECMAGPIAEASFNKHFQLEVAANDRLQANTLLWAVTRPSKQRLRTKIKQLLKAAHSFVEQNREAIFYLGLMIHNRQTILNQDIDLAIDIARQLSAGELPEDSRDWFVGGDRAQSQSRPSVRSKKTDKAA